jgi:DNA processing protein
MRYQKLPDWRKMSFLSRLGDLPHPPKQLYYKGNFSEDLFQSCVAIVGSRRMTQYGKRVIETIVPQLVFRNKTIVSGFMYGVDQYAHTVCVASGGKTIAVLGWGIDEALTSSDSKLAAEIIKTGGLLLSEWEHQTPTKWTFPVRNRIVAALSEEIIVIEAASKSGSLITAKLASSLNRRVWAVPGPITSSVSTGTNDLLASGVARMWTGDLSGLSADSDDPIIQNLMDESLTASELARKLHKPIEEIGAQLSLLTVTGKLVEQDGKYFVDHARKN